MNTHRLLEFIASEGQEKEIIKFAVWKILLKEMDKVKTFNKQLKIECLLRLEEELNEFDVIRNAKD